MTRRLYLGRLPHDTRTEDVMKFFEGYGRIVDCRVMTGFGFVEFENSRDAEEVVGNFNGKNFLGSTIVVEYAKEGRSRPREPYEERGYPPPRSRRPQGIRLIVSGISRDTSWQDLKDFGREAGSVSFADIDRDTPGQGILEYLARDDADSAVKLLDGKDLRGHSVRVALADENSRGGDYRREDRYNRDDRYDRERRDDRHDRDRYRDAPRRERSRSPYRRDGGGKYEEKRHDDDRRFDDRRRSPPFRREDDRRNEERRENRREDRDDRRNGDGNWHRGGNDRTGQNSTATTERIDLVSANASA